MKKNRKQNSKKTRTKEQTYYHQPQEFSYICRHCQHIITFENEIFEDIAVACPNCERVGIARPLQKKEYRQPQQLSFICKHCQHIITFENEIFEDIAVACPNCERVGIIRPLQKKQEILDTYISKHFIENAILIEERKKIKIPAIEVKILGILLIIIGITLHFIINFVSIKISFVLMIIGAIIFTFIPNNRLLLIKSPKNHNKEKPTKELKSHHTSLPDNIFNFINKQFDISEKIAIALILWIFLIYMITDVNSVDIFLILVYLGVLVMKVFSNELIPIQLKQRMNVFTIIFLLLFIIVIIRRLLTLS